MYGVKKEAFKLRKKRGQLDTQPRPKGSTHGVCVCCGRFMEELRDSQCHTPECKELTKKLCMDRNLGVTAGSISQGVWTILKTDPLITERKRWYDGAAQVYDEIDNHTCPCGRALRMPNSDNCALCHRETNVDKMYKRRQAQKRAKQKGPKMKNKIQGLDKIKL